MITTITDAADVVQAAFPDAHVNVISDTGIEVYHGDPEDCYFIQAITDQETGDTEGWDAREGWGDDTYPGTIHTSDTSTQWEHLEDAVREAIRYLRHPTR